jgi:hypothetical protein
VQPAVKFLIAPTLVVILAACSSSAKTPASGSGSSTSTSVKPGNDQAATAFCQDLSKLNTITQPTTEPQTVQALLADGVKTAPDAIKADFSALASYLGGGLGGSTTVPLSATAQANLPGQIETVADYAVAHCGLTLSAQ